VYPLANREMEAKGNKPHHHLIWVNRCKNIFSGEVVYSLTGKIYEGMGFSVINHEVKLYRN